MQQNHIYRPYKDSHQVDPARPIFYIIQHILSKKYYAGFKMNTKPFMTDGGYCTSSKVVNAIILSEGLAAFRIMKIRYFTGALEARGFEMRFLVKVNAAFSERFYNKTNGYGALDPLCNNGRKISDESRAKMSMAQTGRKFSDETREKMSRVKIGKPITTQHKLNISRAMIGKEHSNETREKMSRSRIGKGFSEQAKLNMSIAQAKIPKIECPHCHEFHRPSLAKLWHFDNCKQK